MKTILKSLMMAALFAGLGNTAYAQQTQTATASANVLTNLTIALDGTKNAIDFGQLSATTPGIVVLDAKELVNANTGSVTKVATFNMTGADNAVTVSYDATVPMSTASGTETMTMTPEVLGAALVASQAGATPVGSGTQITPASGAFFLWVGGTIPKLTNQETGIYSGTFNINVEYN